MYINLSSDINLRSCSWPWTLLHHNQLPIYSHELMLKKEQTNILKFTPLGLMKDFRQGSDVYPYLHKITNWLHDLDWAGLLFYTLIWQSIQTMEDFTSHNTAFKHKTCLHHNTAQQHMYNSSKKCQTESRISYMNVVIDSRYRRSLFPCLNSVHCMKPSFTIWKVAAPLIR